MTTAFSSDSDSPEEKTLYEIHPSNNSLLTADKEAGEQVSCLHGALEIENPVVCDFHYVPPASCIYSNSDDADSWSEDPLAEKKSIYLVPQDVVDDAVCNAPEWLTIGVKYRVAYNRISACPYLSWARKVCLGCGNPVPKKRPKFCCMNPFCQDPNCIENRINAWLSVFEHLNIKAPEMLHYVLGFPRFKILTEFERKKRSRVVRVLDTIMWLLKCGWHSLLVEDLSGLKGDLFAHIHGANLPIKDTARFYRCLELARKLTITATGTEFSIEIIGYRDTKNLLGYFAERLSGVFGHKINGKYLTYPDLMSAKEYFTFYYRRKQVHFCSLRLNEVKTGVLRLLNTEPSNCLYCGSKTFILIPESWYKPPPDLLCLECGLSVDARDWNYQQGICRMCAKPQISDADYWNSLKGKVGCSYPEPSIISWKMIQDQEKFRQFCDGEDKLFNTQSLRDSRTGGKVHN